MDRVETQKLVVALAYLRTLFQAINDEAAEGIRNDPSVFTRRYHEDRFEWSETRIAQIDADLKKLGG